MIVPGFILDALFTATIKIGLRAVIGAIIGGPAAVVLLNEPIIHGIVEGALGGVAAGAVDDVERARGGAYTVARARSQPPRDVGSQKGSVFLMTEGRTFDASGQEVSEDEEEMDRRRTGDIDDGYDQPSR